MARLYEDPVATERIAALNNLGKQILEKLGTLNARSTDAEINELGKLINTFFHNTFSKAEMTQGLSVLMNSCLQHAKANHIPKLEQFCMSCVQPMHQRYDCLEKAEQVNAMLATLKEQVMGVTKYDQDFLTDMHRRLQDAKVGLRQYKDYFSPQLYERMAKEADVMEAEITKAVNTKLAGQVSGGRKF